MASSPPVQLVDVRTADQVPLSGALCTPKRPKGTPRFDAVLMMHGATGSFGGPFYRNFSAALAERGVATLRADNRGHDIVNSGDGRGTLLGTAFERLDDCALDWRAWTDFLGTRGFHRILLFGHSLGAVKTAYYLALDPDERVTGCVLASPPRFNTEAMRASERGAEFAAAIAAAEALVAAGKPRELMRTTFPLNAIAGAEAYLAKYGAGARFDVYETAANVPCPVLVLTGALELDDPLFRDHPGGFAAAHAKKRDLEFLEVPNGDHFYTLAQPFAVEQLLAWIDREDPD